MNRDRCKGCITYQEEILKHVHQLCAIVEYGKMYCCPCGICLIKTMCMRPCEDYASLWEATVWKRRIGL